MSSDTKTLRGTRTGSNDHEIPNADAVEKVSLPPRWRQTLGDITNRASIGHNAFGFRRRRRARRQFNRKTLPASDLPGKPLREIAPSLQSSIASAQTERISPMRPLTRPEDGVCVAVRVRPISKSEKAAGPGGAGTSWAIDEKSITQMTRNRPVSGNSFAFDNVFLPGTDNATVYAALAAPVVRTAITGVNGVIFAYGQTAAGKTHTMLGTDTDPGITRRAVIDIFDAIALEPRRTFLLHASYIEIYNEVVLDLLDSRREPLRIHEDVANKRVQLGAREVAVASVQEVLNILAKGELARVVGETNMNERSSRSHAIFSLRVESRGTTDVTNDMCRSSTLNLVDLAGSERAALTKADGTRLKEGGHINKSLLALGTVINKLSSGDCATAAHIPYRDSKLTRILQPALGGNALTAVVCAVSPSALHVDETLSTLRFASRAKKVRNQAKRNEFVDEGAKVRRAEAEIKRLTTENDAFRDRERDHISEIRMQNEEMEACKCARAALQDAIDRQNLSIQALEKAVAAASADVESKDSQSQERQKGRKDLEQHDPAKDSKCSVCKNSMDERQAIGLENSLPSVEEIGGSDTEASRLDYNEPEIGSTTLLCDEVNVTPDTDHRPPDTRNLNSNPKPIELHEELSVSPFTTTDDEGSEPLQRSLNSAIGYRDPLQETVDAIGKMTEADLHDLAGKMCETRGRELSEQLSKRFQVTQVPSGWVVEGFRPRGRPNETVKFLTARVDNIKRQLHESGEKKLAARLKTTSLRDTMMGVHTVAEEIRGRYAESADGLQGNTENLMNEIMNGAKWSILSETGQCPFVVTPSNQNDAVSALERLVQGFLGMTQMAADSMRRHQVSRVREDVTANDKREKECTLRLNTPCLKK